MAQTEVSKKWRLKNKNNVYASNDRYIANNKEKIAAYKKQWRLENKNRVVQVAAEYYQENKEKLKKEISAREKLYLADNIEYKLAKSLRSRLNGAIKKNTKSGSAVRDLGCSIEELKVYLESKFLLGMTWKNHARYGWHIDHIVPLCKFDLSKREELLKACHFTNLQPLWARDNWKKNRF